MCPLRRASRDRSIVLVKRREIRRKEYIYLLSGCLACVLQKASLVSQPDLCVDEGSINMAPLPFSAFPTMIPPANTSITSFTATLPLGSFTSPTAVTLGTPFSPFHRDFFL